MFHIQVGGRKISRRESHFYHQSYYVKTYKDLDVIQFNLSHSICKEVFNYYQKGLFDFYLETYFYLSS